MLVLIFIIYNFHLGKASFCFRIILSFCHCIVAIHSSFSLTRFNHLKLHFWGYNYVNRFAFSLFPSLKIIFPLFRQAFKNFLFLLFNTFISILPCLFFLYYLLASPYLKSIPFFHVFKSCIFNPHPLQYYYIKSLLFYFKFKSRINFKISFPQKSFTIISNLYLIFYYFCNILIN